MKYLFLYLLKHPKYMGRLLPVFLDNCLVFFGKKFSKRGPLAVVWDINNRCNSKCIFCDYWRKENEEKKELSLKEKLEIIKQLGDAGVGFLSFCSGEPLLSKDLAGLIYESKKKEMLVNVSTNGLLLEENAKTLVESGIDSVTISMDSQRDLLYDKLRGSKAGFNRVVKGIEKLRSLQIKGRPSIQLRCLINRLNGFELGRFLEFWKDKVDEIIFKPIYKRKGVMFKVPPELQFQKKDEERFTQYFKTILESNKKLDNLYNRLIPEFIFKGRQKTHKIPCFAGTFFSEIDCQGNLYFCQEINQKEDYKLGNLTKHSFIDLWSSRKAYNLREKFKKTEPCFCWMERFLFNTALFRLLKPLERIIKLLKKDKRDDS
jgi:radical SAM protein with 4Fe4S-binding SPASM domain